MQVLDRQHRLGRAGRGRLGRAGSDAAATGAAPTIAATRSSRRSDGDRRGQHQLAVPQDGHVLADLEDLLEVVRDVEDGDAAGDQLADALEQAADRVALQRRRRLVQQDAPGAAGQRPGDLDDLQLLDRQVAAARVRVDVEAPLVASPPGSGRASRAS